MPLPNWHILSHGRRTHNTASWSLQGWQTTLQSEVGQRVIRYKVTTYSVNYAGVKRKNKLLRHCKQRFSKTMLAGREVSVTKYNYEKDLCIILRLQVHFYSTPLIRTNARLFFFPYFFSHLIKQFYLVAYWCHLFKSHWRTTSTMMTQDIFCAQQSVFGSF